jgi:hypothetical protein
MYTVYAVYNREEIGFGEGESLQYAQEECAESIDGFLKRFVAEEITLVIHRDGSLVRGVQLTAINRIYF